MPDIKQSLLGHDLSHLRIVAEHWGIGLESTEARVANAELTGYMLDADLMTEVLEALPDEAIHALNALHRNKGRLPWAQFLRRFGEVREMGPGRRDRERPDRDPISIAEILWYRALIGRAFFDTPRGTEEFAYIPDDLLALIPQPSPQKNSTDLETPIKLLGRAATAYERSLPILSTDRILDHACTILAGQRLGLDPASLDPLVVPYQRHFLEALINLTGLLDSNMVPDPESTRAFLEAPRGEALALFAQTWLNSADHNDLHYIPNLQPEGEWSNDPLRTRHFILKLLSALPKGKWWGLSTFIADIRQNYPDYQRPAGDYDSWYLKDVTTGNFLRGFEHWDEVDGGVIQYLITGPLHWLGMTDLAAPGEDEPVTAFRLSKWGLEILASKNPTGLATENARLHVRSDGRISIPILTPRAARYQIARFCFWEVGNPHEYRYRLTPSSLAKAREAGLRVNHLISLLSKHTDVIPPNIITALNRWDERGAQVRLQAVTILKLGSPQLLESLRNSRVARFLDEPLGPTTIIVKPGAGERVLAALVEMGYLGEIVDQP